MPKIVKPNKLKNGVGTNTFIKTLNKTPVAGKKVSTNSSRARLNMAYQKMSKDLTIQQQSANTSDNMLGISILHAMGCSVHEGYANMSLLPTQTDTEIIQNENIFDVQSAKSLQNSIVEPEDKFSNTDSDPFYTLDDAPAITILARNESIKEQTEFKVGSLVADLAGQNFSSFGTTTKQFK